MKLSQLKKSTQLFIKRVAKASGMSPEKVLRTMQKPSCGKGVTSHLVLAV